MLADAPRLGLARRGLARGRGLGLRLAAPPFVVARGVEGRQAQGLLEVVALAPRQDLLADAPLLRGLVRPPPLRRGRAVARRAVRVGLAPRARRLARGLAVPGGPRGLADVLRRRRVRRRRRRRVARRRVPARAAPRGGRRLALALALLGPRDALRVRAGLVVVGVGLGRARRRRGLGVARGAPHEVPLVARGVEGPVVAPHDAADAALVRLMCGSVDGNEKE